MWLLCTMDSDERRPMSLFIVWCLLSASCVGTKLGWGVLTMVSYCCLSFGCHVTGSNVAPGFRLWALVVFVVVAAVSVHVGIHLCLFWGICHCLGGRHHCLGGQTMTNNGFESVVCHLVTTSLSVTWHLGCVSVKRKDGDDLLCTVTMLGVITVGWSHVVSVIGQASWMIMVVEKECCGLLMAPKLSIGIC